MEVIVRRIKSQTTMVSWLIICLAIVSQVGCSASQDKWQKQRPSVFPASGIVTQAGEPLENALVVYHSPDGKLSAQGRTDIEGNFVLTTFDHHDGAVAGLHKVAITKTEYVEKKTSYDTPDEPAIAKVAKQLLPAKLSRPETSGLTAEVTEAGPNTHTFDITDE